MFEMVVMQEKIDHQLIIGVLHVDHLMMMLVEKRNLFHQNYFHLLHLLLLLLE